MKPSQIKQALNIRMLRADRAERALHAARSAETQALGALSSAEYQLQAFDEAYEGRVAAFFARAAGGVTPETLHASRTFHTDLANERSQIEQVIEQAHYAVSLAQQKVAEVRAVWVTAAQAAENIKKIHTKALRDLAREQERAAERDADELSIARAFREAG